MKKSKKLRKTFDPKPTFGTVETELFTAGEEGLIPDAWEMGEESQQHIEAPGWESHLNYGMSKQKKKVVPLGIMSMSMSGKSTSKSHARLPPPPAPTDAVVYSAIDPPRIKD